MKLIKEESPVCVEVFQVLPVGMAKYNGMYHVECASSMFRNELPVKSPIKHGETYQEYHGFILPLN